MGYVFDKKAFKAIRDQFDTNEEFAYNLGVSLPVVRRLLYNPNARTMSDKVLGCLRKLGFEPEAIGVDLAKPVKAGRPRSASPQPCAKCGHVPGDPVT